MRKKRHLLAILLVLGMILSACTGAPQAPSTSGGKNPTANPSQSEPAGEKKAEVFILGAFGGKEAAQFEDVIKVFEQANPGIDVVYSGASDFATLIEVKVKAGDTPDIAAFPQPGGAARLAREGQLVELWPEAVALLNQNYDPIWQELATFDGKLYGVFHRVNAKGWIWYNKAAWAKAGYKVPQTWDELMALQEQMKATGTAPWCDAIGAGDATGWKGTDWIENIMLRTQTTQVYDRWVAGELPFSSPEVKNAFDLLGKIWMDPAAVYGGQTTIATTEVPEAAKWLFESPARCWMHFQGSFVTGFFPEEIQKNLDQHVGVFVMPPINPAVTPALEVGGDVFVVMKGKDRPEVRKFIEFLATVESTTPWAKQGNSLFPHKGQDLSVYPTEIERTMARIIAEAKSARFDGSDNMAAELNRAFWKGITDWVSGTSDLDGALKEIDAAGK